MRRLVISAGLRSFIRLFLAAFLLMLAERQGWLDFAEDGIERLLVPAESRVYKFSHVVRAPYQTLRYWRNGAARIADLERQVAELAVEAAQVRLLQEENRAMRQLLGAPLPAEWKFIPAALLGAEENFSINAGRNQGVKAGDAVVWKNLLLGQVVEVSARMSRVRPLSSSASKVVVFLPASGAKGILQGEFGSQIYLTEVLQSEEVKEGDLVLTKGDGSFPRGLVAGKVLRLVSQESDIYKRALLDPLVDPGDLDVVFVVKTTD